MLSISDSELEILGVLWEKGGPMTFGELLKGFNAKTGRDWKKQTLGTFLTRMQYKGQVEAFGGTRKQYQPCISREKYVKEVSRKFLDKYYEGSFAKMFAALSGGDELDRDKSGELRRMLREWERE